MVIIHVVEVFRIEEVFVVRLLGFVWFFLAGLLDDFLLDLEWKLVVVERDGVLGKEALIMQWLDLYSCLLDCLCFWVGFDVIRSIAEDLLLFILLDRSFSKVQEILDVVLVTFYLICLFLTCFVLPMLGVFLVFFDYLSLPILGFADIVLTFSTSF